jgi:uncharacterized protein
LNRIRSWKSSRKAGSDNNGEENPASWPPADLLELPALTLATVDQGGNPFAAALYFAAGDNNRLYFLSERKSQHSHNLAADPRAAVTIFPHVSNWREIRGLQMRGTARPVTPAESKAAFALYRRKFSFIQQLGAAVAKSQMYVFEPDWIRLVDNTRGFGYKEEWRAEESR